MFETGISVYSGSDAEGWGTAVEGVPDVAAAGWYFSTSSRRILPSGPEPLTLARGIPRSSAIFFAIGEAKIRSPLGSSDLASCLEDSAGFDGAGSVLGASGAFSSFGASFGFSEAASEASLSAPERSSPSSPMMAMVEPTAMFFAPSLACEMETCDYVSTVKHTGHVQGFSLEHRRPGPRRR